MRSWPFCVWILHTCGWQGHQDIPMPSREHSSRWQGSQKRKERSCSWRIVGNWYKPPVQNGWTSKHHDKHACAAFPSFPEAVLSKDPFLLWHQFTCHFHFYGFAFPCRLFLYHHLSGGISLPLGPWRLNKILNTKRFSLLLSNFQMLPPGSIFPGGSQV